MATFGIAANAIRINVFGQSARSSEFAACRTVDNDPPEFGNGGTATADVLIK
jgi:hypothetical protein